jgi:hypothetical protein
MGIDNIKFSKPGLAKWKHLRRSDDSFVVYRPDGSIYGEYATLSEAAATVGRRQKEDDERARKMVRPCLCCGHKFQSEGIHNRMCDRCRHLDVAPDPVRSVAMARRA